MKLVGKIVFFAVVFSATFFFLHATYATKAVMRDDLDDLGGTP
jgi:hypothetical protein